MSPTPTRHLEGQRQQRLAPRGDVQQVVLAVLARLGLRLGRVRLGRGLLAHLVEREVEEVEDVLRVLGVTRRRGAHGVQHGAVLLHDGLRDLQTLRIVLVGLQRHHQLEDLRLSRAAGAHGLGELVALDVHVVDALQLVVLRQVDDVVAQRLRRQQRHVGPRRGLG